jgi:hypothetical protein
VRREIPIVDAMEGIVSHTMQDAFPTNAIFIIGAGHFGARAADLIGRKKRAQPIFVVDFDDGRLRALANLPVSGVLSDGIRFLDENFKRLDPENTIVPAVPEHLAFQWLKRHLSDSHRIQRIPWPAELERVFPNVWHGSEGSLLVSYADFMCPDDCPEPPSCTVTGERRERPLYDLIRGQTLSGFAIQVIRSRQIAPGLGGYRVKDLVKTAEAVKGGGDAQWILGTACKCHGILTAFKSRIRKTR